MEPVSNSTNQAHTWSATCQAPCPSGSTGRSRVVARSSGHHRTSSTPGRVRAYAIRSTKNWLIPSRWERVGLATIRSRRARIVRSVGTGSPSAIACLRIPAGPSTQ